MFSLDYAGKKKKTHENMSPLIPATIPLLCVRTTSIYSGDLSLKYLGVEHRLSIIHFLLT